MRKAFLFFVLLVTAILGLGPKTSVVQQTPQGYVTAAEAPEVVFSSIDTFLAGKWPAAAERVTQLALPSTK